MEPVEVLYLSMRGQLRSMVARIVPADEVEDIVQETYLRLRRVTPGQEITYPRSYLYQTARNLALDSLKRSDNSRTTDLVEDAEYAASPGCATPEAVDASRSFESFCASVELLPQRARQVFVLKKVYGYTQREIAEALEIAESTVEKHVALGLRRCAEQMNQQSEAALASGTA